MKSSGPRQTTGGWERKDARNVNQAERELIFKLKKSGYSRNAIAIKLGRGNATISRVLRDGAKRTKQRAKYWTRDEDAKLIRLTNEGKSQVEIAEALDRSRGAVAVRLSEHRKAALQGTEIRYTKINTEPVAMPAPASVRIDCNETPESLETTALGLPAEIDLYAVWHRAVFGGGQPA
jgi:IS30 family transposase